jgi:hypothetical protein
LIITNICGSGEPVIRRVPRILYGIFHHQLDRPFTDFDEIQNEIVAETERAIVEKITQMVQSFITPANALILGVSPATDDLMNSDALRLARREVLKSRIYRSNLVLSAL